MIRVSVVSLKGGVGKTTIVANLATALAQLGNRVLAVDLDPQNSVRLHLGIEPDEVAGIAPQTLSQGEWGDVLYHTVYGVDVLPFGEVPDATRDTLEQSLKSRPNWLQDGLQSAADSAYSFVIMDTPSTSSLFLEHALRWADNVLVAMLADAASFALVPSIQSRIEKQCVRNSDFQGSYFVLNQMDVRRQLDRDIRDLCEQFFDRSFLDIGIHNDAAVREALAQQRPLLDYATNAQAAHDIQRLAKWLNGHLMTDRAAI